MSLLEEFVGQINGSVFFREFAISSSVVRMPGVGEIEVADHLVLLEPYVLAFQIKERDPDAAQGLRDVSAWFRNKVQRKGVRQLRNTLKFLEEHTGTHLTNDRGHRVTVFDPRRQDLSALVIYRVDEPAGFAPPRSYNSRHAGFVHFMSARDYFNVCHLFVTPTEVIDYLAFRERLLCAFPQQASAVSEAALAGQFLLEVDGAPAERYSGALSALREAREHWDLSYVTDNLGDQIMYRAGDDRSDTSHYRILSELAKLSRSELAALKERFRFALEAVREDRFVPPYRFAVPRTDCGFMVVAALPEMHATLETGLGNLSAGSKYAFRTTKHVGLAVARRDGYIDLLWLYLESPWRHDEEIERLLRESNPFRATSGRSIPRYLFDVATLRRLGLGTTDQDSV